MVQYWEYSNGFGNKIKPLARRTIIDIYKYTYQ